MLQLQDPIYSCRVAYQSDAGQVVEEIKNELGMTIRVIDFFLGLININLVDAIINKVGGDFVGVDLIRQNWGGLGLALDAAGQNYQTMGTELPKTWRDLNGPGAATLAASTFTKTSTHYAKMSEACSLISKQVDSMLTCVVEAMKLAAAIIGMVVDWVVTVPVAKIAKLVLTGAKEIVRAIELVRKAITTIDKIRDTILPMMRGLALLTTILKGMRLIVLSPVAVSTHAGAGNDADDVANAGLT